MTSDSGLSVFIVAKDAQQDIRECLSSVRGVADEIVVVVESSTRDGTAQVAREFTSHVFLKPFEGFSEIKSFAMSKCSRGWVMNVDTDECITPELASALEDLKAGRGSPADGFAVNRLPYFLGRPIRHGGWYPDWVVRVSRREHASYPLRRVHERMEVAGRVGRLAGHLLHHTARQLRPFLEKQKVFASLSDARPSWVARWTHPPAAFFRSLILKAGWLDGWRGWVIAWIQGYNSYLKYARPRFE